MNRQQSKNKTNANQLHQTRVEAGKKAAKQGGHESLSKAGQKGGQHSHRES